MDDLQVIIKALHAFRDEREWKQFHDSKNLAIAISIEASELNELFLWKDNTESEKVDLERIKDEIADILSFTILLAAKHNLNIKNIVLEKIQKNKKKYPISKSKGISTKYNELK